MSDRTGHIIDGIAILVALGSLSATLFFQFWQGPSLQAGIGQDIFINGQPRIGLLCSISNSGAKAGTVIGGELRWQGHESLRLSMISPQFETWRISDKLQRIRVSDTTLSYVFPLVIQPHASLSTVLWFTADRTPYVLKSGEYVGELSLYDGVDSKPVVRTTFRFVLDANDAAAIADPKNSGVEIPVRILLQGGKPLTQHQ